MKQLASHYFIQDRVAYNLQSRYTPVVPTLLQWLVPSFIRRAIINVALGPNEVTLQNAIHVLFLTDDRTEHGLAIINLIPPKSSGLVNNYFDNSPIVEQRQLSLNHPEYKAHLDSMIAEIDRLLAGNSQQPKCTKKKFSFEQIHLKGLERLDEQAAQYFKDQIQQKYGNAFFDSPRTLELNFYTLETAHNTLLESVAVSHSDELLKPISQRKFVISCMARNQNYMYWLKDFYTSATQIGCTVIGFNYRGIDYSQGQARTQDDIINDALAQAQRLIQLGVAPEHIAFEGMSFGAAIATHAAAKMHEQGLRVSLYNERSYRSLVRLMIGYIVPEAQSSPWNPINWLKYIAVGLSYLIIAPVIWFIGWHLNAANAWKNVPFAFKSYSIARNHENPACPENDDLVHDSFTSIASLMEEHQAKIIQKKTRQQTLSTDEQAILAYESSSSEFTLDKNTPLNTISSPHAAPRRFLWTSTTKKENMHSFMVRMLHDKLSATHTCDKGNSI